MTTSARRPRRAAAHRQAAGRCRSSRRSWSSARRASLVCAADPTPARRLPVRTVDFWMRVRIARTAAGRPPTNTHAATSKADDVDSEGSGWSLWPMITPPRTGPTIWPSAETVVSVPNLLMRASELCAWAMMLWPPMVPDVCPMPSAVVAIAMAGICSATTRAKAPRRRHRGRAPTGSPGGAARSTGRSRPRAASAGRRSMRPSGRGWCRRRRGPAAGTSTPGGPDVTATCSRKMLATVPTSHSGGRERRRPVRTSSHAPAWRRRPRHRLGRGT